MTDQHDRPSRKRRRGRSRGKGGGGAGNQGQGGGGRRRASPAPVGIDFGTAFSALADFGPDGLPHALPNRRGAHLTPSALTLTAAGRLEPSDGLAGDPADGDSAGDGRDADDGDAPPGDLPLEGFKRMYVDGRGSLGRGGVPLTAGGGPVTPRLLGAAVIRYLAAGTAGGLPEGAPVVLTVPHAFTNSPRRAVLDAGRIAGLDVTDALAETTAAALAWMWRDVGKDGQAIGKTRHALIYDLGAGTFDAAIVRARGNDLQIVAAEGDPRLGGRDWTDRLVAETAARFRDRHGFDPVGRSHLRRRLAGRCERAKLDLSRRHASEVLVEANGAGEAVPVTRAEFERLTADLLERTRDLTELMLDGAGLDPAKLDVVLPVGGAAGMPAVRRMLGDLFGQAAVPRAGAALPDPRTAVAEGAAIFAAMRRAHGDGPPPDAPARVRRRLRAVSLEEVSPHSVGVEVEAPGGGGRMNVVLLPRNGRLPASVQTQFATTVDNPEGIRLRLVEGESPDAADCDRLGEYRICGLPPGLPAGSPVHVTIVLDHRNAPHVAAHRVSSDGTEGSGGSHDLLPLEVVRSEPTAPREDGAAVRERLARMLAAPR